jgi:D-3-phosphoglycerate dehydrogenase
MKILLCPPVDEDLKLQVETTAPDAEVVMTDMKAAVAAIADAEILFGTYNDQMLSAAGALRWIQTTSAGMDGSQIPPALRDSDIRVCNASGVHAIQVAEHAFALMMALLRGVHESVRHQAEHAWKRPALSEVYGATVAVVGFGGIGRKFAEQCHAFDARILALDVQAGAKPDYVESLSPMERFDEVIAQADVVFIACPLTDETHHLIDAHALSVMKPTAFLVNTARGPIVDEAALHAALQAGEIAGAGLDVTEVEPLPADSPLWDLANVILTPHAAGGSPRRHNRTVGLFCENLKRYMAGEPLLNEIDKSVGYPGLDTHAGDIRAVVR